MEQPATETWKIRVLCGPTYADAKMLQALHSEHRTEEILIVEHDSNSDEEEE